MLVCFPQIEARHTHRIALLPVPKPKSIMVGSTTKEENDTKNNKPQNRQNLDRTEYKLCFSKEGNSDDVEGENDEKDDGDPDSDRNAFSPVLDDDCGGGDFGGEEHGEGVPVVPSWCCVSDEVSNKMVQIAYPWRKPEKGPRSD